MASRKSQRSSANLNYVPYSFRPRDYYRRISCRGRGPTLARNLNQLGNLLNQQNNASADKTNIDNNASSTASLLTQDEHDRLIQDLEHWNSLGVISTYDMNRRQWSQWLR